MFFCQRFASGDARSCCRQASQTYRKVRYLHEEMLFRDMACVVARPDHPLVVKQRL